MPRLLLTILSIAWTFQIQASFNHLGRYLMIDDPSGEVIGTMSLKPNHTYEIKYRHYCPANYQSSDLNVFRIVNNSTRGKVITLQPSIQYTDFKSYIRNRYTLHQKDGKIYMASILSGVWGSIYFIKKGQQSDELPRNRKTQKLSK